MTKQGTVVITGKPNVGKSTLINYLAQHEIAITSPKPQTTRNQINFIFENSKYRIAFIDTPGFHFSHNKLDDSLNRSIKNAYKYADCAILLIDLSRELNEEDQEVIKLIKRFEIPKVVLVANKVDLDNSHNLESYVATIKQEIKVNDVVDISAISGKNVDQLLDVVGKYLSNNQITIENTDGDNFIISEIIREQIIKNFRQEIPYATSVYIKHKEYKQKENKFIINADIIVEKASQKPIILGAGGKMIKTIRVNSLKKLHTIYDCNIELHLFVVVKEDWRNNEHNLKDSGYF